jgi:hypothetical protein
VSAPPKAGGLVVPKTDELADLNDEIAEVNDDIARVSNELAKVVDRQAFELGGKLRCPFAPYPLPELNTLGRPTRR